MSCHKKGSGVRDEAFDHSPCWRKCAEAAFMPLPLPSLSDAFGPCCSHSCSHSRAAPLLAPQPPADPRSFPSSVFGVFALLSRFSFPFPPAASPHLSLPPVSSTFSPPLSSAMGAGCCKPEVSPSPFSIGPLVTSESDRYSRYLSPVVSFSLINPPVLATSFLNLLDPPWSFVALILLTLSCYRRRACLGIPGHRF